MVVLAASFAVAAAVPAAAAPPGAEQPGSGATIDAARLDGAVAGGLRWLAERQTLDGAQAGAWPVGIANYRPAVASLAGLAFLANGHLPGDNGPYGETVARALNYVMSSMARDGYLGQGDRSGMYIHAISALFALSCLGMQADEAAEPELAEWCRRSVALVLRAQQVPKAAGEYGGWRYDPYTTESDVSVTCWQLLVLHTAMQAGFTVEPTVYGAAQSYLNRAYLSINPKTGHANDGAVGGYLYRPGYTREPSRSTTALVLFIQSLFDLSHSRRTQEALAYLRRYPLTWDGSQYGGFFFFSGFYMVQGMFQIGGEEWESFRPRMAALLLDHQSGDGSWPYPPGNEMPALMQGTGPAYPVALSVLMLSLDKQYLPMYQRQSGIYESSRAVIAPPEQPAPAATESSATGRTEPVVTVPKPTLELPALPAPAPTPEPDAVEAWEDTEPEDFQRPSGAPLFGR